MLFNKPLIMLLYFLNLRRIYGRPFLWNRGITERGKIDSF